jgi:hypothetical protein
MKRRWSYAIPIALLLVSIGELAIGCAGLSSTSPLSSLYPADIIGRVTIPKYILIDNMQLPPGDNAEWWIVKVSIKNKGYQNPITSEGWKISTSPAGGDYSPLGGAYTPPPVTISKGQSGEIIFCFKIVAGLNPTNYQISYLGQQPYSYGLLVNVDIGTVAYDWYFKKIVNTTVVDTFLVTVNGKVVQLKVIKSFTGDNTKIVDFTTDKSPVVVAWWTTPISQIQSSFTLWWQSGSDVGSDLWTTKPIPPWSNTIILEGTGRYRLKIESSGYSWRVKVGVE